MKNIFLFTLSFTFSLFGFAQDYTIKLKSGELNLTIDKQIKKVNNIKYYFMLFNDIPSIYKRLAKDGVFINNLRIGVTNTKIHRKDKSKNMKKRISLIPIKRMATPIEIAKYIYQLSSSENTFVTGETFTVAGGE